MAITKDEILDAVGAMSVMELNDLVKAFEEKFGSFERGFNAWMDLLGRMAGSSALRLGSRIGCWCDDAAVRSQRCCRGRLP